MNNIFSIETQQAYQVGIDNVFSNISIGFGLIGILFFVMLGIFIISQLS